jgi:Raf kinase inhibitor-like YbhB/YbcL family protein
MQKAWSQEEKKMELSSTAFKNGEYIPNKYTGEGLDVSPPLKWSAVPEGTKSIALIADDPDAPRGTWTHWVAWDIPPDTTELPEAVPAQKTLDNGIKQGANDFGKFGYGGPMPPPGSDHRYYFRVYALKNPPNPAGAKKKDLEQAMQGQILGQGELMGRYKR